MIFFKQKKYYITRLKGAETKLTLFDLYAVITGESEIIRSVFENRQISLKKKFYD